MAESIKMAWNDALFRTKIAERAAEIGKTQAQVAHEAGLSKGWFGNSEGRTISSMARILEPLQWTPQDLFQVVADSLGWDYDAAGGTWLSNTVLEEARIALKGVMEGLKEAKKDAESKVIDLSFRLFVANAALDRLAKNENLDVSIFAKRTYQISASAELPMAKKRPACRDRTSLQSGSS